ncbi:MAG: hypothetical protein ABI120_03645, partial [Gemmatimonadaceae bacterium]
MTRHRILARCASAGALVLSLSALRLLNAQAPVAPPVPEPTPRAWSAMRQADLKRNLFAMASPEMRGREGGTLDELRASIWVAEQYSKIGLVPMGDGGTWFQWFNLVRTRVSTTASRVTIGNASLPLFTDIVANAVVPVEASGAVLWLADAADTTVDISGRIVATPVVVPAPASVRSTSYPTRVRYAEAAIAATMRTLAARKAAAVLIVASDSVDAAFDAISVQRARGLYDVDHGTPRAAGASDRVAPVPVAGTGTTPSFLVRSALGATLRQQPQATMLIQLERFESPSVNVIGGLRGTDPKLRDEWVLYSSH